MGRLTDVTRATAVLGAAVMLAVAGCGDQPDDGAPRGTVPTAAAPEPAERPEPAEPTKHTKSAPPTTSAEPTSGPIDISGPLVIPESDPAEWPPGVYADLSPAELDAAVAAWGAMAGCSPYSLLIDYEAGALSPEEYTTYAVYALARWLPQAVASAADFALPERYVACDDMQAVQILSFVTGAFFDYIDPAYRNELWLRTQGITYDEANRPMSDEEMDKAFEEFYGDELPPTEP